MRYLSVLRQPVVIKAVLAVVSLALGACGVYDLSSDQQGVLADAIGAVLSALQAL